MQIYHNIPDHFRSFLLAISSLFPRYRNRHLPNRFSRRNLLGHSGPLRLYDGFLAYGCGVSFGVFRVLHCWCYETLDAGIDLGLLAHNAVNLGLLADAGVNLGFLAYASGNLLDLIPSAYMVIMMWVQWA